MNIYPYAGFWRRCLAYIMDCLIVCVIAIPVMIAGFVLSAVLLPNDPTAQGFVGFALSFLFLVAACWLYYALLESSSKQATVGKMALGLKVINSVGERISFWRATGRFFARMILAVPTFNFSYMMAGFTRRSQTLHDIVTSTYVVGTEYTEQGEPPEHAFRTPFCIVCVVLVLLMVLIQLAPVLFNLFTLSQTGTWN